MLTAAHPPSQHRQIRPKLPVAIPPAILTSLTGPHVYRHSVCPSNNDYLVEDRHGGDLGTRGFISTSLCGDGARQTDNSEVVKSKEDLPRT